MAIITIKKVGIIEEGIYKVNSVFSFQQKKHASNFLKGIIVDPKASILRIGKLLAKKTITTLITFLQKTGGMKKSKMKKR